MTKVEKILINQKRQEWNNTQKEEFKTLFPDIVELDEDGEVLESFSNSFAEWLNELEQYEVTTTEIDEDGNEVEVTNTYSRKLRPMPRFAVSKAEIETYNTVIYAELRAKAYPPIEEQLDMQYKDILDGGTRFKDAIEAVKNKYPKYIEG